MGAFIKLTASDGHRLDAYQAGPEGTPKAGLVVVQEIFGVNEHIRAVADGFAAAGYASIAPAIFDRLETGVDIGYDAEGIARGRELKAKADIDDALKDVAAAAARVRSAGKVGVVGYCWGGSVTWLAALRLDVDAAVCYYGGGIAGFLDEEVRCPTVCHFGETDASIPMTDVEAIKAAHPERPLYVYPAGHGFNCDRRADYHEQSAALALERTLAHFGTHLAGS